MTTVEEKEVGGVRSDLEMVLDEVGPKWDGKRIALGRALAALVGMEKGFPTLGIAGKRWSGVWTWWKSVKC